MSQGLSLARNEKAKLVEFLSPIFPMFYLSKSLSSKFEAPLRISERCLSLAFLGDNQSPWLHNGDKWADPKTNHTKESAAMVGSNLAMRLVLGSAGRGRPIAPAGYVTRFKFENPSGF